MGLNKSVKAVALVGCLLSGGLIAEAGTSWGETEYRSVPGTNGTSNSSGQTKAQTNASSDLSISKISDTNKMDTRAIGGGSNGAGAKGAWVRDTNVGSYAIPNSTEKGWGTSLEFSSDLLSNGVSITYKWKSN